MRANRLQDLWRAGRPAVAGWLSIGNAYSAEIVADLDPDCVVVDLQHAMTDFAGALGMLQAISGRAPAPLVRALANDGPSIMKLLDAGAYGVICPMIDTAEQCERFVAACRYPPRGGRSYGPARGLLYGGPDYFEHADRTVLTLAMIETATAMDNLDAILAVDGLDAVFVGPNDLAVTMGRPPGSAFGDPDLLATLDTIVAAAHGAGRKAGLFCPSAAAARAMLARGFDLVTAGSDAINLRAATAAAIAEIRGALP